MRRQAGWEFSTTALRDLALSALKGSGYLVLKAGDDAGAPSILAAIDSIQSHQFVSRLVREVDPRAVLVHAPRFGETDGGTGAN